MRRRLGTGTTHCYLGVVLSMESGYWNGCERDYRDCELWYIWEMILWLCVSKLLALVLAL